MSQQINLYQPIFRTQQKIFSARTIVQTAGVFIIGLLLIYGYGRWQVSALDDRIAALDAQRETAMQQLQTLSAHSPAPGRSRLVEDQLREARADAVRRERLLRAFETRRVGNTQGFATHFSGLARQRVDGLWLTRIEITDGSISFDGATEVAELLPRYITRLGRERAFAGTEFARLQMNRGERAGAPVEFSVSTAAERAR